MIRELYPGAGIGEFRLGARRDEVRRQLRGSELTTHAYEPENDLYLQEGLILGYSASDTLEFVEAMEPNEVCLEGVNLFDAGLEAALRQFALLGNSARRDGSSYYFDDLCVVLFAPEGALGSVATYKEGYYRD